MPPISTVIGAQLQELGLLDQELGGECLATVHCVVAKAIDLRLQHGERLHVGLLLRGVRAARREWHCHIVTCLLRGCLDCR